MLIGIVEETVVDSLSWDLLLEIIRCPLVDESRHVANHPCQAIVASQPEGKPFQIPEPWSGHIDDAPLLFIGSNPSYWETEDYPTRTPDWSEEHLDSFFTRRFEDGWVKDGVYGRFASGAYSNRATRYWASIRQRARELLQRDPRPGVDYCMTEVIHCKSRRQKGVGAAFDRCCAMYLRRILEASGAKVMVAMGYYAAKGVRTTLKLGEDRAVVGPVSVGSREVYIAFVPHPAAWAAKRLDRCLAQDELALLRSVLR